MTEKSAAPAGTGPDQQSGNGITEKIKPDVTDEERTGGEASANDNAQHTPGIKPDGAAAGAHPSPKKRRKVNHGKAVSAMHPTRIMAASPLFFLAIA